MFVCVRSSPLCRHCNVVVYFPIDDTAQAAVSLTMGTQVSMWGLKLARVRHIIFTLEEKQYA